MLTLSPLTGFLFDGEASATIRAKSVHFLFLYFSLVSKINKPYIPLRACSIHLSRQLLSPLTSFERDQVLNQLHGDFNAGFSIAFKGVVKSIRHAYPLFGLLD